MGYKKLVIETDGTIANTNITMDGVKVGYLIKAILMIAPGEQVEMFGERFNDETKQIEPFVFKPEVKNAELDSRQPAA